MSTITILDFTFYFMDKLIQLLVILLGIYLVFDQYKQAVQKQQSRKKNF
ncbi:hypothetical protein PBAC_16950 [Pedobacter glucosidilyticus]|nr:hypothetical protein PBAC_16950 [Pedobacter glucosidilyticus]